MIAPKGYLNFSEIAEWAREIARDIAWEVRKVPTDDGFSIMQAFGERSAVECWAVANLLEYTEVEICSPSGVTLRAPPKLNKHFDQIEILPIPIPIEESTIQLPEMSPDFEISLHHYFSNRFAFFSWRTGCVDTSKCEPSRVIGQPAVSQFSTETTKYLIDQQGSWIRMLDQYQGWSICVESSLLGETTQELYAAFGVDELLIDKLGLSDAGFFQSFFGRAQKRPRKRDKALDAYEERFPHGHESEGISIKEATNEVSDAIGTIISVDTLRRALGKKG
ncbi:MAG: hypothetical protein P8Q50_01975 [Octadecabacter sp.]|nr:hypothetical protein [Octadecabacter sp.]